jgi:phage FluMu protein Com
MQAIRCKECNKALVEAEGTCTIRKKCPRCHKYNVIKIDGNKIIKHNIED